MLRFMASRAGDIIECHYHAKARLWIGLVLWIFRFRIGETIDFETEYTDGSFLLTSNAVTAGAMNLPPTIHAEYLPFRTPAAVVLARHRLRMAGYAQLRPTAKTRKVTNLADALASQNRQNALKAAYRGEIGGITKEELENCGGRIFGGSDELEAKIREIQARGSDEPEPAPAPQPAAPGRRND